MVKARNKDQYDRFPASQVQTSSCGGTNLPVKISYDRYYNS